MSESSSHGGRNALILIAALIAIWQVTFWVVGDIALSSPLATLRYTGELVTGETFGMELRLEIPFLTLMLGIAIVVIVHVLTGPRLPDSRSSSANANEAS